MPVERTGKRAADHRKKAVFREPRKTKKTKAVFREPKKAKDKDKDKDKDKAKDKAKDKDKDKDKAKDKAKDKDKDKDIYPLNPPLRGTHSSVFGQFTREKSGNSLLRELSSG